jgi:hypothetical protein
MHVKQLITIYLLFKCKFISIKNVEVIIILSKFLLFGNGGHFYKVSIILCHF